MIARIVLFLAWLAAAACLAPSPAAACGEDNQEPCQSRVSVCDTDVMTGFPYCGFDNVYSCNYPSLQVDGWWNKLCKHRKEGAGLVCCTQVNYTDPYGRLGSTSVTEGYHATVNLTEAWILVPSQTSPDWCAGQTNSPNPVKTVEQWMGYGVYAARLMINANFWNPGINPHLNACNLSLGLAVSNKALVSPDSPVHGQPTSSLVFFTPEEIGHNGGRNAKIVDNAWSTYQGKIQNAVSGFWLLRGGNFVSQPVAIDPDDKRPRAAVGLSADGNTLYPVVVNPGFDNSNRAGATTLHGLADYLKRLGATDALTLDGSGSAQLVYYDPQTTTSYRTKPSDVNNCDVIEAVLNNGKCYRPVPMFLGIE